MRNITFIGLLALVLIFVIQNTQVVEFRLLVWTFPISRALVLFGTLAVGIIAGWLLTLPKHKQQQKKNAKK